MLPVRMLGLLMLTASLSDINSLCPSDFDGPVLIPQEVIGAYGDSLSVNCTSNNEWFDRIYFKIGNDKTETDEDADEDALFASEVVSLSDWSIEAECIIQLNDSRTCSKELPITVYQTPEVSLSVLDETVSAEGTLYKLQCDVMNVAPIQNVKVTWYKNNESIRTESFNDTTKTPVNVSSDLLYLIKREENVVQIECEAQLVFEPHGPQLPAVSQTRSLSAVYAPEFILNHDENFSLPEGEGIILNCDAEGNPPPVFSWSSDGVNVLESTSSLHITNINSDATYTCTASNHLGSTTKSFFIHIMRRTVTKPDPETPSTPRDCPITLMPSEIVVRYGDPLSVNCSTSDPDVLEIGWTDSHGITETKKNSSSITWRVEQLKTWNRNLSCSVHWFSGYQCEKRPTITVYKFPDNMSVSTEQHGAMVEGKLNKLKCNISNVAPVQKLRVIWYQDDETLATKTFRELFSMTPTNVSSILEVIPKRNDSGSVFTCKAELDIQPKVQPKSIHSVASASHTAVVHYAPEFKEVTDYKEVSVGINVTFVCSAEGNPPPEIHWNYTSAVNLNETTVGRQKIINITRATSTNAGVYNCVATNEVGNMTKSVTLVIKDASSSLMYSNFSWYNVYIFAGLFTLFVIILVIVIYQHSKKHGQYSFVPDKAKDNSDIPLTPQCAEAKV